MTYLPLSIVTKDFSCLVVGEGAIGKYYADLLASRGAEVTFLTSAYDEDYDPSLGVTLLKGSFSDFLTGNPSPSYQLVVNTADSADSGSICEYAKENNAWYFDVHSADSSTAIVPRIVEHPGIISTFHSRADLPAYERFMERQLDALIPKHSDWWFPLAEGWRSQLREKEATHIQKRQFWGQLFNSRELLSGDSERLQKKAEELIGSVMSSSPAMGEVYLIGAGPGDPELLTLRAFRIMQNADVVFYDALVSDEVMSLLPDRCEKVYVGKRKAFHAMPQEDINQLLADCAKRGNKVIRLKGGDPFIFGRGGEELELLMSNDVPFQVIPGITAASGCSTYAGIPLTHRDYAQSVRFITGHLKKDGEADLKWDEFVADNQTLVFYMGLTGIESISNSLIAAGKRPDTGAALVEKGTTKDQKVYTSTLEELPSLVMRNQVKAPTLIIIGDVVHLHQQLQWL